MRRPVAGLQHQPGHLARVRPGGHGNVFEPAAQVPLRIGHRGAEQRGQADPGCGARGESRLRPDVHRSSVFLRGGLMRRSRQLDTIVCQPETASKVD